MLEAPQAEGEMSGGYCPAGKCNCHNYRDNPHGKYCAHSFDSVGNFEQCPWPSCQVSKQISERTQALADAKAAVIAVLNANGSPSVGVAIIKAIEGVK